MCLGFVKHDKKITLVLMRRKNQPKASIVEEKSFLTVGNVTKQSKETGVDVKPSKVPDKLIALMKEFKEIISDDLLDELSPLRDIQHYIEPFTTVTLTN